MINILLVDDHELVRTGIEVLLNAAEGIKVLAIADSGEQAVLLADSLNPDVILMDVIMPGIGGAEACHRILQQHPQMKIIALSAHNDGLVPAQLLKVGAMGFISKTSPVAEMVAAIHAVMEGKCYVCNDVSLDSSLNSMEDVNKNPFAKLSKREGQVIGLILKGKEAQEIAAELKLNAKTVGTYRHRSYDKLGVKNVVELMRLAEKFKHLDGL